MSDLISKTAKLCHEINRIYCQSIGDQSQPTWEDAPEWQRQSARNGVMFHMTNPGAGPAASHQNWLKEKLEAGWVYGFVKDAEAKKHPCCVAYEFLPKEQRRKDDLFIAVVKGMTE